MACHWPSATPHRSATRCWSSPLPLRATTARSAARWWGRSTRAARSSGCGRSTGSGRLKACTRRSTRASWTSCSSATRTTRTCRRRCSRPQCPSIRGSSNSQPKLAMTARMVEANGVELCTESFGSPSDAPILLIMGSGASMLWWEEGFCQLLADGARFVIRYDHRDTGRSVTYEVGRPGYTGADLVADVTGVLDAYNIPVAHLVGVSAGGAFAQLVALDHRDRVSSLVLISTSPALPGERDLPGPTDAFGRFVSTAAVDWSDADSVIEY